MSQNRAREFFQTHVFPSIQEWRSNRTDIRLAMNAAVVLNQMADHFWHEYQKKDPIKVFNKTSVSAFRKELTQQTNAFALVRDVAEAHKHVKLHRPDRYLTSAGQTTIIKLGYGKLRSV